MINSSMLKGLKAIPVQSAATKAASVVRGPLPLYFAADETTPLTIQQVEALPRGTVYVLQRGDGLKHAFTR
jgi:hypothetical protein